MNDLDELIKTGELLIQRLERAAKDEKKYSDELCHVLEQLSWEAWRSTNDLKTAIERWS
jgi:hypothetical protein